MTNQTINKSFIIHKDSLSVLNKLTDEQAGKLFKAIFNYQTNNVLPEDTLINKKSSGFFTFSLFF